MIVVLSPSAGNPDLNRWGSSVVEHVLGKDEVAGSNPVPSSIANGPRLKTQTKNN